MIRLIIHKFIVWYLTKKCGGTFHHNEYGDDGRYITIMNEKVYNKYTRIRV